MVGASSHLIYKLMEGDKKTKQRKTKNLWQINKYDNIKGQGNKVNTHTGNKVE